MGKDPSYTHKIFLNVLQLAILSHFHFDHSNSVFTLIRDSTKTDLKINVIILREKIYIPHEECLCTEEL